MDRLLAVAAKDCTVAGQRSQRSFIVLPKCHASTIHCFHVPHLPRPFAPLRAQVGADAAVPDIDPSLTKVLVAGYWEDGATRGFFRVVEISEAAEEIRRRAVVQWLSESPEEEARVVASRATGPLAGNVWSVSGPDLVLLKGHWYLMVRTTSRSMGQPDGRVRIALGAPGDLGPVSRRRACA